MFSSATSAVCSHMVSARPPDTSDSVTEGPSRQFFKLGTGRRAPIAVALGAVVVAHLPKAEMKIAIALASLVSLVTVGHALAQTAPLTYTDIVREARRYEKLEGSERAASAKILFKQVRLGLKPFSGGSRDFYVSKKDEIGFICQSPTSFKGGTVIAKIVKHEEGAEGSHFYTLDSCTPATK